MADLPGWTYWKVISITGQSGAGTDYQVKLTIGDSAGGDFHLKGHCTNFPQDIRITDDDGTTLLDHWVEDLTADPIIVHVEVKDDLGSNQDIRVYYGKSGETTASNGANTFLWFDSFEDGDTSDAGDLFVTVTNRASSTQAKSGTYSMKAPSSEYWTSVSVSPYTLGTVSNIHWIYCPSTSGRQATFWVGDGTDIATNAGPYIKFEDGDISSYNGSSWVDTGLNHSVGWNKIEIITQTATTFDLIVNDGTPVTGLANRNTISNVDRVGVWSGTASPDVYYDDYCIRKYNDPEPAFSGAGAEQTPGLVPVFIRHNPALTGGMV